MVQPIELSDNPNKNNQQDNSTSEASNRLRAEVPSCCGPSASCCNRKAQEQDPQPRSDRTIVAPSGQPSSDAKSTASLGQPTTDAKIAAGSVPTSDQKIAASLPTKEQAAIASASVTDQVDLSTLGSLVRSGELTAPQAIAMSGHPELASYLASIQVNKPGDAKK